MCPFWTEAPRRHVHSHSLGPLPFLRERALAVLLVPQEGWEALQAELLQWSRGSSAQVRQRPQPATGAEDSPASACHASPRSAKPQPPQHSSIKSHLPPKFYSCLLYGIITAAINNKTHTDIDPLAMAVWSFMLRKIHIQAKQRRVS